MNNGIIIHLDNEKEKVLDTAKHYFDQLMLPIEYICCSNVDQFNKAVEAGKDNLKAIVFDLLEKEEEIQDHTKSPFNEAIINTFKNFNVPVFIYSGYLSNYNDFIYNGTVIKIDKGNENGFKTVADKIVLFHNSGFLEIFCPNGLLEKMLQKELHQAFVKQFSNENDIENILVAIQKSGQDFTKRTKEVFSRVALRSLISSLMIDNSVEEGFNECSINVVEHYIRRINLSGIPYWTGDIFIKKDKSATFIIVTPRCDLATKGKEVLLVCNIKEAEFSQKNIKDLLRDNIKEKKFRHLPKTPIYKGGKVDLSDHFMIAIKTIEQEFDYLISLSDDLTNEILGKFCAYLMRTSVPDVNFDEAGEFLK